MLNADSHLPTLSNRHVQIWHVPPTPSSLRLLDLLDDIQAAYNLAKDNMLAVKMRRWYRGDEELGAVGVRARVLEMMDLAIVHT